MDNLTVLYESENYFVIDKPPYLVVNKAESQKDNITLFDILVEKYVDISQFDVGNEEWKDFIDRAGIVHRLDKDTSGVIIVAKNPDAFSRLQELFKTRQVRKKYNALVYGRVRNMQIGEQFEISAPIQRNPRNREKFAVSHGGKESLTQFKILNFYTDGIQEYTLLECEPKTGRTHQIRVHLTALGHPVVGDKLYSGKQRSKKFNEVFERQFLHAVFISFLDPFTNQEVEVKSSMPKDLTSVLDSLKEAN